MVTVAAIFKAMDGPAAVGRAIGVTTEHAAFMRRRGSIPVRYWPALLEAASKLSPPPVTDQALIEAHTSRSLSVRSAIAEARP